MLDHLRTEAYPVYRDQDDIVDFLAMAGQHPYVLANDTPPAGDIALHEVDLGPDNIFSQAYSAQDVLAVDLNHDGVPEIVMADETEQNRLWRCEYLAGQFGEELTPVEDATGTNLPPSGALSTRALAGDINNDGHTDLVAINLTTVPDIYLSDVQNNNVTDGSELFCVPDFDCKTDGGWDGALVDITEDGRPDLVLGSGTWKAKAKPNQVYHWCETAANCANPDFDQAGFYRVPDPFTSEAYYTRGVAVTDINGDGKPDVIFANENFGPGLEAFINCQRDGQWGYFGSCSGEDRRIIEADLHYHTVAPVDRGDDPPDLIAGGTTIWIEWVGIIPIFHYDILVRLYRNKDDGTFWPPEQIAELEITPGVVTRFVPINLDDPTQQAKQDDFFLAIQSGRDYLLKNDGAGGFEVVTAGISGEEEDTWSGAAGDLNGDGLDDLYASTYGKGNNKVFLNNVENPGMLDMYPEQYFSQWYDAYRSDDGLDVVIADLFGDWKPEILVAGDGQNRLLHPDW